MDAHDTLGQQAPDTFPCPECQVVLPVGSTSCPACGIRLSGPLAAQLWRVNNQIAGLSTEARRLRALLLQPPSPGELTEAERVRTAGTQLPRLAPPAGPGAPRTPGAPVPASSSLSGQQVLLGLGALLLLSGVAFFLIVVWTLVGLVGQAVIMVTLTGLAAAGAALATRKRLPAGAETAAVIASGLLVLDLWAAHRLGLAGLDGLDADLYWTFAAVLGAAILVGFDTLVPRRDDAGDLRRIVIYRPVVLLLLTVAVWAAFFALDLEGLGVSLGGLVVAGLSAALLALATRLGHGSNPSVGAVFPGLSLVVATLVHLGVAVDVGYDNNPTSERVLAMLLLLVAPTLLLIAQWHPALRGGSDGSSSRRLGLRVAAVVGFVLALGVPVMGAERGVVVAVAVAVGVLLTVLAMTGHDGVPGRSGASDGATASWGDLLSWTGRAVLPLLFWLVFLLAEGGMGSGVDLRAGIAGAGQASWWLPVLPAVAFVMPAILTAVRRDSVLMAALAHAGAVIAVLVALRDAEAITWSTVTLAATVLVIAVAAAARWAALSGRSVLMEPLAAAAGSVFATTAVATSFGVSAFVTAMVLVGIGALLLAYSALPDRLGVAYVATLAVWVGIGVLLGDRGVDTVELYTAPGVALLAGIGAIQWLRDRSAPTVLTMGPALAVALVPSLLVAVTSDSGVRLIAVTTACLVVLLVGMAMRWQAPVILAGACLVILAATQGGPLVAYIDGWVTLVLSGALLLLIGVLWERAITLGRRTSAWLNAMQ